MRPDEAKAVAEACARVCYRVACETLPTDARPGSLVDAAKTWAAARCETMIRSLDLAPLVKENPSDDAAGKARREFEQAALDEYRAERSRVALTWTRLMSKEGFDLKDIETEARNRKHAAFGRLIAAESASREEAAKREGAGAP